MIVKVSQMNRVLVKKCIIRGTVIGWRSKCEKGESCKGETGESC